MRWCGYKSHLTDRFNGERGVKETLNFVKVALRCRDSSLTPISWSRSPMAGGSGFKNRTVSVRVWPWLPILAGVSYEWWDSYSNTAFNVKTDAKDNLGANPKCLPISSDSIESNTPSAYDGDAKREVSLARPIWIIPLQLCQYDMAKRVKISIKERKLGREKAWGQCWKDGIPKIEIDPRLKSRRYLTILIHELLHACCPEMSETEVDRVSARIGKYLWLQRFRRIEK